MSILKSQYSLIVLLILVTLKLGAQDVISVDSFDEISVLGNIQVVLEKGEKSQVMVDTYDISEDDVSIFVQNGRLKLHLLKTIFRDKNKTKRHCVYTSWC